MFRPLKFSNKMFGWKQNIHPTKLVGLRWSYILVQHKKMFSNHVAGLKRLTSYRMKQKCTEIAVSWIHLIVPWKRSSYRNLISWVQKHYTTIVIGTIHSFFAHNSGCTLHEFAWVHVQLMCHLVCVPVMVKHLGIYIVKTSYLYLNGPITVL